MLGLLLLVIALYQSYRKKFYYSLILFFLLLTNGFQVIPVSWLMAGIPLEKGSDFAIIYVLIITVLHFRLLKQITSRYPVFKYCLFLLLFILADVIYSLVFLGYSTTNVFQVFRPYLVLLVFIPFFITPLPVLKKVFHSIAYITVLQSIIFIYQIISGQTILLSSSGNQEVTTGLVDGTSYIRFYNSPIFLYPVLFYYLFVFKYKNPVKNYFIIGLLTITVIGPMHRSVILSILAVISVYILFKQTPAKRFVYFIVIGVLIYAASFISIISDRIDTAITDIQRTSSSKLNVNSIDIQENTTLFRIGHLVERYDYVYNDPAKWLFGIGMISDNAPYAQKLPFQFGLPSEKTGGIVQIDTADLTWSLLILNLGIAGTIFYAAVFIIFLVFFYKNSTISNYSTIGFLTILFGIFTSMFSSVLLENSFRVIAIMLLVIVCKEQKIVKSISHAN